MGAICTASQVANVQAVFSDRQWWDVEEMRASGSFGTSCSTAPPTCGAQPPTPLSPASSQLVSQQLASPPTDQPQPASNSARQQWRR